MALESRPFVELSQHWQLAFVTSASAMDTLFFSPPGMPRKMALPMGDWGVQHVFYPEQRCNSAQKSAMYALRVFPVEFLPNFLLAEPETSLTTVNIG